MKMETIPMSLSVKLASLVVHVQEARSTAPHVFDAAACEHLANDTEVQEWIDGFDPALLPVKRSP